MSTITLPKPARWDLPAGLEAAGQSRRLTRDWLTAWAPDAADAIDDACLSVSELAANAAEHGTPPVTLALSAEYRDGQVIVTAVIHDGGAEMPKVVEADLLEERHRGLAVIAAVTDRWGIRDAADGGKDMWVEITIPASAVPKTHLFPERIFATLTRRASAHRMARIPRQHDKFWPHRSHDLTDERSPFTLTAHAEQLLGSAAPDPEETQ